MSLAELTGMIFLFNVLTFGAGPTMIPLLQKNLVDQRGVLTSDQLLYAFAVARVTPGPANLYVSAVGFMLFGLPGAILAILVIQLPGYVMLPLMRGYESLRDSPYVARFTRGLTVSSVGLIFAATLSIGRRSLTGPVAVVVLLITLGLGYLKWNPLVSMFVAGAVGVVLHYLTG